MDKETLSHYGWIVILVLILAVLLALATPFGNFIAEGFKAAYAGFGMVSDNAMNITDLVTGKAELKYYQPYRYENKQGEVTEVVFHKNGTYDMYWYYCDEGDVYKDMAEYHDDGTFTWDGGRTATIAPGGTSFTDENGNVYTLNAKPIHYIYYGQPYKLSTSWGYEREMIFNEDGSVIDKVNGATTTYPANYAIYGAEEYQYNTDRNGAVYPNGMRIVYQGYLLSLDCSHENTEVRDKTDSYTGDEYCKDCDELIKEGELVGQAYAIYTASNGTLWFIRANQEPQVGDMYNGAEITNVYSGIETDRYYATGDIEEPETPWNYPVYSENTVARQVQKVVFVDKIKPVSLSGWFADFKNCGYYDLRNLDASIADSMNCMFYSAGTKVTNFEIIGLGDLDVSNVKSFTSMFRYAGTNAKTMSIGNLDYWNTASVTNIAYMFGHSFQNVDVFDVRIVGWKLSNVTEARYMFNGAAKNAGTVNITIGYQSESANQLKSLPGWFMDVGLNANSVTIDMSGFYAPVTNLSDLCCRVGQNATSVVIKGLDSLNVANLTTLSNAFSGAGQNATTFQIQGVESWRPTKLEYASYAFSNAGANANYTLNLRNWGVTPRVRTGFKTNVESKILTTFG